LVHFARRERGIVLKRSVIAALNIVRVSVGRPPTHHVDAVRRRRARTFTLASRIVDPLDLSTAQRAVEDFNFIH
jgi:hypothetical protein